MELSSACSNAEEAGSLQLAGLDQGFTTESALEQDCNEASTSGGQDHDPWDTFTQLGSASELLLRSLLADPSQAIQGERVALVFKEGQRYVGQMVDGQLQGQGRYSWPDGLEFQGAFERSRVHTQGTVTWPDGAQYTGQLESGHRHGVGSMTLGQQRPGLKYTGDWSNGLRHGKGKLVYGSSSCWYSGEWCNDQREGEGTFSFSSGGVYWGQWKADRRHGRGTMVWQRKEMKGPPALSMGAACIVSPPATVIYRGEWQDGLPHGSGEQIWLPPGELVDPVWMRGEGPLELTLPALLCNRYVGRMDRGKRTGEGIFYYSTGAQYKGTWSEDLKDGPGRFVSESGSAQQAAFSADRLLPGQEEASPASAELEHVEVHVDDLLEAEEDPERCKRALAHVLLRNTSELRNLYAKYSRLDAPGSGEAAVMTSHQLGVLLRDAKLLTPEMPLARVHTRLLARFGCASEEGAILFREFVEAVVRVAHHQTQEALPLEAKVQRLIMTQLIPLASLRLPASSDRIAGFLGSPAGVSFVKAREALLRSLLGTEELPDSAAEGPVTAGQGLALIQSCWGDAPRALPVSEAALNLLEVMGVLDESTGDDPFASFLMDTPITSPEIWAALFHHVDKLGYGAGPMSTLADKVDAGLRAEVSRREARPAQEASPSRESVEGSQSADSEGVSADLAA